MNESTLRKILEALYLWTKLAVTDSLTSVVTGYSWATNYMLIVSVNAEILSYTIFIQKFIKGQPAPIKFEELRQTISAYGEIESDEFGLKINSSINDMFESANLHGDIINGITGISINRPTDHDSLSKLIFDLLKFEGTCFFGQGLEFLITRHINNNDLPHDLVNSSESGITIIDKTEECWPIKH